MIRSRPCKPDMMERPAMCSVWVGSMGKNTLQVYSIDLDLDLRLGRSTEGAATGSAYHELFGVLQPPLLCFVSLSCDVDKPR